MERCQTCGGQLITEHDYDGSRKELRKFCLACGREPKATAKAGVEAQDDARKQVGDCGAAGLGLAGRGLAGQGMARTPTDERKARMPKTPQVEVVKTASLVLDYNLYPRQRLDATNVREIVHALEAGITLPPIVADRLSRRVVDGFHRVTGCQHYYGTDAEITVLWQDYPDDTALFEDAMRLNAGHGRKLTPFDQARCLIRAKELHLEPDRVAAALSLTVERLVALEIRKVAIGPDSKMVPIKYTLRHLAGQQLTKQQVSGNQAAGGPSGLYFVNQVINLLEQGLVDWRNPQLLGRLDVLTELLTDYRSQRLAG